VLEVEEEHVLVLGQEETHVLELVVEVVAENVHVLAHAERDGLLVYEHAEHVPEQLLRAA
jgi:hypothetical protein